MSDTSASKDASPRGTYFSKSLPLEKTSQTFVCLPLSVADVSVNSFVEQVAAVFPNTQGDDTGSQSYLRNTRGGK